MIIVDQQIKSYDKLIEPFNEKQLQPASYDLKLESLENGKTVIEPGESILGVTEETVNVPFDLVGIVFGKSSIGRLFLNPIDVTKFNTICQIAFIKLDQVPEKLYGEYDNHYQNQKGIVKSHLKDVRK